jgi:hypothetical protein
LTKYRSHRLSIRTPSYRITVDIPTIVDIHFNPLILRTHFKMRVSSLATALLLPLLAIADTTSSTTTITSTATLTKTITVSQVVAVTSTYPNSTTIAHATGATGGTVSSTSASATKTLPANYMGAASSLNGAYAGSAAMLVMIAAALL